MTKPTCKTCIYWLQLRQMVGSESISMEDEEHGQCRRHPPDPAAGRWQITKGGDFCGDHNLFVDYLKENG